MRDFIGIVLAFLVILVLCLGLAWIVQGNDFALYRYFGPRLEDTRREIFEHSKAYRQGMTQELEAMQFQYEQASPSQRDALASIILHRAADVDPGAMPESLASFVARLRREHSANPHKEF